MTAAQLRSDRGLFQYRVAGVAIHDSRILLQRAVVDDFWSVPGGRVHVGETASEALIREMQEELAVTVVPGKFLWVIENFFTFRPLDMPSSAPGELPHHELGLYLEMAMPDDVTQQESFRGVELADTADEFELEFRWFSLDEVPDLDVRPAVLRRLVATDPPAAAPLLTVRN